MTPAADVAGLVPQAGVARLVEAVLELRADGIDCEGRICARHPLARDGAAPAFLGLELAAQAAAVFEALRRLEREGPGRPRVGFLVSLRDVRLDRDELPSGAPLLACVRALGGAAPLALYQFRVLDAGTVAAEGTLGTFLPADDGRPGR